MTPPSQRDRIDELAESFVARFRAGERPSIEEYARKYPDLVGELRQLLPALVMLERHGSLESNAGLTGAGTTTSPVVPSEIGEFTIVREIGRGGMGVVYEAVQQSLGRHVALKVLSSPGLLNPVHLERFRLEARSAGRLHHSHIVPVFGVGEHHGLHYYAMQFIAGQSLDQVIDALRKLRTGHAGVANGRDRSHEAAVGIGAAEADCEFSDRTGHPRSTPAITQYQGTSQPRTTNFATASEFSSGSSGRPFYDGVARVGLQVAEALAYAHAEGVLHRDIKPSNILLDAKGNIWVTDFGLVKSEESQALTESGDLVGTLRYMAPERLEGWSDRRSDLYGLGATLYELLTLRPFFEKGSRAQLIDRIRHQHPEPPAKIDAAIPRDLETIVLKSLAKEPASRYHTAEEMADDLRRFLADHPILARRSTPRERFIRWCRRNPAVASLSGIVVALLLAAVAILTISNARIRAHAERSEKVAQFLKDTLRAAGPSVARGRDATLLREILDRTGERVEKELQGQAEVQADLWLTLGTTYADIGNFELAVHALQEAAGHYRLALGDENAKLALALGHLGRCQSFIFHATEGRANAVSGYEMAQKCGDNETIATCLSNLAESLDVSGIGSAQGVPYMREAVELRRQLGDNSAALARCLNRLANALRDEDPAEAEPLVREALALHRQSVGADHPALAADVFLLGQILLRRDKVEEAETTMREAVTLYRKIHDKNHPYQGLVMQFYAQALIRHAKVDDVEAAILGVSGTDPAGAAYRELHARITAWREDWDAAAEEFLNYNGEEWKRGIALVKAGRRDEYLRLRSKLLESLAAPRGPYHVVRNYLLLPVEGVDLERVAKFAHQANTTDRVPWMLARAYLDKSLAEFRVGQFDAAKDWASRAVFKGARLPNQAQAWFIQALACARLQQMEAARGALDKGDGLLDAPGRRTHGEFLEDWSEWAIAEILRQEAVELIQPGTTEPIGGAETD